MERRQATTEFQRYVSDYIESNDCYGRNGYNELVTFMPRIALEEFWNTERIENVLRSPPERIQASSHTIKSRYIIVFSILVFMSQAEHIPIFIQEAVEDLQLPLAGTPYVFSETPESAIFGEFHKHQWKFCPLEFGTGHTFNRRHISPCHVVPVLDKTRIGSRGTADEDDVSVYKVKLHPRCFHQTVVVFKVFIGDYPDIERMYLNEVDMYSRLARENAFNHIIRYYGSFETLGLRTIILEYANGGSLKSFFASNPPPHSQSTREQFWNSLMGLLRGIESIQNLNDTTRYSKEAWMLRGAHHDIKPQNILLCNRSSENMYDITFKLVNMETGSVGKMKGQGLDCDDIDRAGSGMYSGPEACQDDGGAKGIYVNSDVWSFGGIASEALVWCIWGEYGRSQYQTERFRANQKTILKGGYHEGAFHNGDCVLDVVADHHRRAIAATVESTDWWSRLSDLILKRMLVPEPRERATATELIHEYFGPPASSRSSTPSSSEQMDNGRVSRLARAWSSNIDQESDDLKTPTATVGNTSFAEVHSGYSSTTKQTGKDTNPTSVTESAPTSSSLARDPKQLIETSGEYDDIATVLTDNEVMDVVEDEKTAFVEKFATLVHGSVLSRLGGKALDKEVKQAMRHLLKSFAIKLFRTEQSSDAKDISTFVRHYRNHITLAFQDIVQGHLAESPNSEVPDEDFNSIRATEAPLTLQEIFFGWNSGGPGDYDIKAPEDFKIDEATRLDDTGNGHERSSLGENDMDIIARVAVEKFSKYQEVVVQSHAFEWLLDEISKHARLNLNDAVAIHNVQTSMKEALGISTTTDGNAEIRLARFEIDWDPCEFINQQGYDGLQLLECALTLSGTAINTQLLPCRQYLRQCWPNLGETVLDGILAAMQKGYGNIIRLVLYDDTSLSLHLQRGLLTMKCKAAVDAIIEIAEIMAWIGSSLREASSKDEVFYVTPCLSQATNDPKAIEHTSRSSTIRLSINFQEESIPDLEAGAESGLCWRGLLGNPVIAKGFPVPLRGPDVDGLEVSLPVMALLLDAERLTTQRTTIFLKGFNAAAVPTAIANDIVHWHLVTNKTGDRLSYNDARLAIDDKTFSMLNEHVIRKSRHVLGWTLNAVHNVGSSSAAYDGLWTSPDFTASRLVLEKIIVQGGFDPLTVGVEAAIGKKDPAPNIVRRDLGYTKGIEFLVGTYIVLYDTRDHRAWLANGASALLHLTRASLRHGLQGPLSKEYVLEESQLEDNSNLSSPQAAVNFLCDRDKLQIPILRELLNTNETSQQVQIRFIDCVNHIRHVLEQLIDYQATVSSPGMALTLSPRSRLEGYKFMDIAAGRPITPCAMKLNIFRQGGKSWVDFTRAIKAVTLFGKGFGELMIPASDSITTCSKWQTLPKGRDYLAVSTYDLARIIEERGDFESKKLAPSICWHQPAELFEACACTRKPPGLHRFVPLQRSCDRVQVLLPETPFSSSLKAPSMLPDMLGEGGAVIFGRSRVFAWTWPDEGGPEKDSHVESVEEDDTGSTESIHSLSEPTPNSTSAGSRSTAPTSLTPRISSADVLMAPDSKASGSDASGKSLVEMGGQEKKTLRQRLRKIAQRFSLKDDLNKKRGPQPKGV